MRNSRPVVLTFLRYYLPGEKSGGPVRTLANMVEALGDEVDFRIVTSDRDVGDPGPYPDVVDGGWRDIGKARVLYLRPYRRRFTDVANILRKTTHDTLYLNSFFDPVFTALPLLARRLTGTPASRCVIAPRGEFSPGALQLKATKKRAYRAATSILALYRNLIWQASSEREAADIAHEIGGVASEIRIAPDLATPIAADILPFHPERSADQPLRVVFLSRISPMKNLDFALAALQRVKAPVVFDIYGQPEEQSYWAACRQLIETLPPHVKVRYCGVLPHHDVPSTLVRYDLFFLPTRGENYGHAIVESLAVGTPVLISDATPWRNLSHRGIGWDLPLSDPAAFAVCLDQVFSNTAGEAEFRRQLAAAFVRDEVIGGGAISASRALFRGEIQPSAIQSTATNG